jgi:peptidyl-Asp metalloendopeptidase
MGLLPDLFRVLEGNLKRIVLLSLIFSLGLTGTPVFAIDALLGDAVVPSVFGIQALNAGREPAVIRNRPVSIALERLAGNDLPEGADSILLNLFGDVSLVAQKDRMERRGPNRYTWFGTIPGVESGQAILVVEDGSMAGNITVNGQMYQIRAEGESIHAVREIDQSVFPDEADPIPVFAQPDAAPFSTPTPQTDDGSIIDVLVVYTAAAAGASGNITSEIQLAIDETNQSYANSGIAQRVRLVHSEQVVYTETGNSSTDLDRLQGPSDGYIDNVHTLRESYGADVVSLWVESLDACGIGYLMIHVSTSFAPNAFSVVARDCATGYYSFGHEMGHNMGAHHDRYASPENGAYSYSHGYVYVPDKWRTVMAYNDECSSKGYNCKRIPYWSNPNVSYNGIPTGIANPSSDSANNSLTLQNTAYTVANFRQAVNSLPIPELITVPSVLNGPLNGAVRSLYTYGTGGSSSNLNHPVQYLFDWGDGTDSDWLPVGTTSAQKEWSVSDTYAIKAKARCATDRVESGWSDSLTVNMTKVSDRPDLTGAWRLPVIQTCKTTGSSKRCTIQGTLEVMNFGGRDVSTVKVYFYLSGDGVYDSKDPLLKRVIMGKIRAGDSREMKLNYWFPPGSNASGKFVIGVIDPTSLILEGDEFNNQIVYGPIP